MTNPTSNFGWQMPTSTDLVTDLPADFEVFGQAVDTDFVDLLGGTTGQVLSKTSATDLDFTWINNDTGDITGVTAGTGITGGGTSGTVTVTNDMATTITAAGDIVVGTGSGTYDNLPIGTTAQILTADTTVSPYKVKWATPAAAASGLTFIRRSSFSSVATTTTTFDGIFTSTYKVYIVIVESMFSSTDQGILQLQFRAGATTKSGANYYGQAFGYDRTNSLSTRGQIGTTLFSICELATANNPALANITFDFVGNSSQVPTLNGTFHAIRQANTVGVLGAYYADPDTMTGLIFSASAGNITGIVSVYGLATS